MKNNTGCTKHKMLECPRSCWKVGRTRLSFYDGKFVTGRTFDSLKDVETSIAFHRTWEAEKIAGYEALELPVPPQYYLWTFVVWDGTNGPDKA